MSTNLATILVGLGYDLSALEKGAPEAFRLINQQTLGMSAEMKRASREGAESFRLIDEAWLCARWLRRRKYSGGRRASTILLPWKGKLQNEIRAHTFGIFWARLGCARRLVASHG